MPATRVDFKYIREHADFAAVATAYGLALQKDGPRPHQFKCLCPFHDDHEPSLKVNTEKNIFNCFACDDGHGNVLEFVMKLDSVDIRTAAKTVADISGLPYSPDAPVPKRQAKAKKARAATTPAKPPPTEQSPTETESELDGVPYNQVLSFTLKNLITEHPFITERGLTAEMLKTFGLGIATRGIMKDRLVFPIHDADGGLVAYCGRYVGNDPPEDEPKYKQPPNFRKELELFNWHRVKDQVSAAPVVLVESFFSVVKLWPDYPVVSPMGRSLSERQIELLSAAGVSSIVILFDGDDPGRQAVTTVGRQLLATGFTVSAPVVLEDFKPHRCPRVELHRLLNGLVW